MQRILTTEESAISLAAQALKDGQLIIYPTDTAYAIGADFQNVSALQKVQQIKQRTNPKPLPLIAASIEQIKHIAFFSPEELRLAKQYWPGPLTLLLKPKKEVPLAVNLSMPRVAIRVPNAPIARQLAVELGRPIVATSANKTGEGAMYDPDAIAAIMSGGGLRPQVFLDAGLLAEVLPSTIIEVKNGKVHIVRPGPISIDAHV